MTAMRILVTGGSGFIGRHVVAALCEAGHHVTVVDRKPHPDVPYVTGELEDPAIRDQAVAPGTDAIVHLAAETSVLGSISRPARVHSVNVDVTAALLELAREREVGAFVLASTNAVAGPVEGVMTEQVPLAPLTPYGATKAAGEVLLSGYSGAFGLRTPALRLTNVYGPGMLHKDSFVPRLLRAAAAGEGVQVYGDGFHRRDLIHVRDVARAFALAVTDWPSGPVIIGNGTAHTVRDLVEAAREATGCPIPVEHVPARTGEMRAVVVDPSLARSRGFEAATPLAEGIGTVWPEFSPDLVR